MNETIVDPWEARADHLAENDWVILDDFLPTEILTVSRDFLKKRLELDEFRLAGIGALRDFRVEKSIRSDEIFWLERKRDKELEGFFTLVDEAIVHLNRLCFLSISGSEFHLAHYPEGSFYKRHLDQFDSRSNRLISMVFYLSEYWKAEHGGELRLYAKDGTYQDVAPLPGRMILFKSEAVPHEVLLSKTSRYSITGWLLHQPPGLGYRLV